MLIFSPKGTLFCVNVKIASLLFRSRLGSACDRNILSMEKISVLTSLPELVLAIGAVDLVLGELDR